MHCWSDVDASGRIERRKKRKTGGWNAVQRTLKKNEAAWSVTPQEADRGGETRKFGGYCVVHASSPRRSKTSG
jgi:hypothetical protein